jgi:hypothetical protein
MPITVVKTGPKTLVDAKAKLSLSLFMQKLGSMEIMSLLGTTEAKCSQSLLIFSFSPHKMSHCARFLYAGRM